MAKKLIEWKVIRKTVRVEDCTVMSPPDDYLTAEDKAIAQNNWEEDPVLSYISYEVGEEWTPEDE